MLIIKNEDFEQLSVFDQMLPKSCLELKGELAVVDKILDDESLLAPFIEKFNSKCGRHTTPVDTYIRMMYLNSDITLDTKPYAKKYQTASHGKYSAIYQFVPKCLTIPLWRNLPRDLAKILWRN
ncbi:hypothetical protein L1766_01535 [Thermovorax subterraneus]|nr:hypothetical protein [Thermovorax subterraneus]